MRDIYRWTRKIDGKTVTRLLTKEQKERYETWFDSARRIHALIAELEHSRFLLPSQLKTGTSNPQLRKTGRFNCKLNG